MACDVHNTNFKVLWFYIIYIIAQFNRLLPSGSNKCYRLDTIVGLLCQSLNRINNNRYHNLIKYEYLILLYIDKIVEVAINLFIVRNKLKASPSYEDALKPRCDSTTLWLFTASILRITVK